MIQFWSINITSSAAYCKLWIEVKHVNYSCSLGVEFKGPSSSFQTYPRSGELCSQEWPGLGLVAGRPEVERTGTLLTGRPPIVEKQEQLYTLCGREFLTICLKGFLAYMFVEEASDISDEKWKLHSKYRCSSFTTARHHIACMTQNLQRLRCILPFTLSTHVIKQP